MGANLKPASMSHRLGFRGIAFCGRSRRTLTDVFYFSANSIAKIAILFLSSKFVFLTIIDSCLMAELVQDM
jgi:hypothetical protein